MGMIENFLFKQYRAKKIEKSDHYLIQHKFLGLFWFTEYKKSFSKKDAEKILYIEKIP